MDYQRLRSPKQPRFTTLDCLNVITDLSEGSHLKKERHKKMLAKAARHGRLAEVIHDPDWRSKMDPKALKETDSRDWLFRISNALLWMGDYSWWGWEHRSAWGQMCWSNAKALKLPMWDGKPERVLLLGEQGVGDEIMFSSCIPDMLQSGAQVTYMCDPRLIPVFERSFGIKCIPRVLNKELTVVHSVLDEFDSYFPLGELARYYRQSAAEFPGTPYLLPNPGRLAEMARYKGRNGVSWRGRNGWYSENDFPAGLSLQYDTQWYESPPEIHIDPIKDLDGLITLVSVLDSVQCVSTSLAHIAGAVGTKADVILAPIDTRHHENMINWRWRGGQEKQSPWYGSVKIYRGLKDWNVSGLKQWRTTHGVR